MNKWALSLVKNVARVEQLRRFAGSWFQAEGAATENEQQGGDWNVDGTMQFTFTLSAVDICLTATASTSMSVLTWWNWNTVPGPRASEMSLHVRGFSASGLALQPSAVCHKELCNWKYKKQKCLETLSKQCLLTHVVRHATACCMRHIFRNEMSLNCSRRRFWHATL